MMIWWRFKGSAPGPWALAYMTNVRPGLVRMGLWNGDTQFGRAVSPDEIETKPYVG